jgi:hypothetical protein
MIIQTVSFTNHIHRSHRYMPHNRYLSLKPGIPYVSLSLLSQVRLPHGVHPFNVDVLLYVNRIRRYVHTQAIMTTRREMIVSQVVLLDLLETEDSLDLDAWVLTRLSTDGATVIAGDWRCRVI